MERLTERINGVVVYTQGKYTNTTAGEMTSDDVRKVLAKLCEYEDKEHMTNADRIRNFSDEELAEFLHNIGSYVEDGEPLIDIFAGEEKTTISDDFGSIKEWLQAEVKEGDTDE